MEEADVCNAQLRGAATKTWACPIQLCPGEARRQKRETSCYVHILCLYGTIFSIFSDTPCEINMNYCPGGECDEALVPDVATLELCDSACEGYV